MSEAQITVNAAAAMAVSNVLAGRTADGLATFPLKVPFTADPESRALAAKFVQYLAFNLPQLTVAHLTPLAAKLLIHLNKTAKQNADTISLALIFDLPPLRAALADNPDILFTKAGMAAILRIGRLKTQPPPIFHEPLPARIPPRIILWQSSPYRIEEATDPRHLVQDSDAIGHCAGTLYDSSALRRANVPKGSLNHLHHLHHWIAIREGLSRIFTLTRDRNPIVTMEYLTGPKTIDQLEATETILGDEDFFRPLCRGLSDLRHRLGLNGIRQLASAEGPFSLGKVVTHDGNITNPTCANLPTALAGFVDLIHFNARYNALACANPLLDVCVDRDTTQNDRNRITRVAGSYTCMLHDVFMPNLTHVGRDLDMPLALFCNMPVLLSVGSDINAEWLEEALLPRLESVAGRFLAPSLEAAQLSSLQTLNGREKTAAAFKARHHKPMPDYPSTSRSP